MASASTAPYGAQHQATRRKLLPTAYGTPCPRCGLPMLKGQALDLGHSTDLAMSSSAKGDRIEHADCNRRAGQALAAALRRFGAKSIAVLTPHQPRGDEQVRHYFEDAGFIVKRLVGMKCASPTLIAHTPAAEVVANLRALEGDDVDALVQTGTNLAAIRTCAAAERWLGKPVLALNAVTYWDALRRSGIADRIDGCGSVLEQF